MEKITLAGLAIGNYEKRHLGEIVMFDAKHKCLTCGYIGHLDYEYNTDQDKTFATF
jgi:hypothetical protein